MPVSSIVILIGTEYKSDYFVILGGAEDKSGFFVILSEDEGSYTPEWF